MKLDLFHRLRVTFRIRVNLCANNKLHDALWDQIKPLHFLEFLYQQKYRTIGIPTARKIGFRRKMFRGKTTDT